MRRIWSLVVALSAPCAVGCSTDAGGVGPNAEVGAALGTSEEAPCHDDGDGGGDDGSALPVDRIEEIVGAEGHVSDGVLAIDIAREDIGMVRGPRDVTLTPAFEVHGSLYFQPIGDTDTNAFLNGDMALLESEVNPFIAMLIDRGLVFQAYHQHMPTSPQLWFVHFRGTGDPVELAADIRAAINVTATPLPQTAPMNPTTPLDADRLASILHGEAEIGDEGVVTVTVHRTDEVLVAGIRVNPEAGISTSVEFRPKGGDNADVVPDFSMTADEVNPVVRLMLNGFGWYQGCLYNQETDEHPQLYFDHMVDTGNAYQLAREIREGLDLTRAE
jgi:hypothetical protein